MLEEGKSEKKRKIEKEEKLQCMSVALGGRWRGRRRREKWQHINGLLTIYSFI